MGKLVRMAFGPRFLMFYMLRDPRGSRCIDYGRENL
jgi:hypothetical protein